MKLRIKYDVGRWIMWKWRGRVLYPFMLFSQSKEDVTDGLFRHEMQHVYQVRRMGWWKFHFKYLWLVVKRGYEMHPFELEAVERQNDELTKTEIELKNA